VSWIKRPARSGAMGRNLPAATALWYVPIIAAERSV
jgi:hypothetical protein